MRKNPKPSRRKKIDERLLPKEVQIQFAVFLQHHPPKELCRELRSLLIEFMYSQLNGTSLRAERIVLAMEGLFTVLEKAEDHWKKTDIMELWKYSDDF